jgi:periplasmic protein TonB
MHFARPNQVLRALLVAACLALPAAAFAQFTVVPKPVLVKGGTKPSKADDEKAYRKDAARHLYASYPKRVKRGKMPPMLYGVMVVETEIDASGKVVEVHVVRKPAADIVAPWVVNLIKRAGPFPAPTKLGADNVRYVDTWLVDKSGFFQLDTLTEGQR